MLMYRLVQKKGTVFLSTSLAWPAVAGCSRVETFSQLSPISFAQPCIPRYTFSPLFAQLVVGDDLLGDQNEREVEMRETGGHFCTFVRKTDDLGCQSAVWPLVNQAAVGHWQTSLPSRILLPSFCEMGKYFVLCCKMCLKSPWTVV